MAELTITLRRHPGTGRRELVVHLEGDEDLLPHEHERDHRRIVEALIGQSLGDDTDLVVERTEKKGEGHGAVEPTSLAGRVAEKKEA